MQTKGKRDKECSKEAQSPHWHEASRGKLFSSSPSPVFAGVSEPFYIQRLKEIPTPSKFGKEWEKYQDSDDPLFGCLRPGTARGIPPALMHPAFGEFLDLVKDMALDSETCDSVMRMIDTMSSFYRGRSSAGEARGREAERARIFRQELLKLMATLMQKKPATLEPSSVSMESESATDGSYAMYDSKNKKISQPMIIEVKVGVITHDLTELNLVLPRNEDPQEDFGQGGGSNPTMQLIAYYSKIVSRLYDSAACQQTCFPTIGIELYGNVFRAHALYLSSNKICCEPLTPLLHLSDMRLAVPGYTEMLARTMKALVMTIEKLQKLYEPFYSGTQESSSKLFVSSYLPYALQKRYVDLSCTKNC